MPLFDIIIANPPYGSPGKKIYNKLFDYDKAVVLMPKSIMARLDYKEPILNSIRNKCINHCNIEQIPHQNNHELFGLCMSENLIIVDKDNSYNHDNFDIFQNTIYNKVKQKSINFPTIKTFCGNGNFMVKIRGIYMPFLRTFHFLIDDQSKSKPINIIHFMTENEAINFINWSLLPITIYFSYIFSDTRHIPNIPIMPSYEKPWNNNDVMNFYGLNNHEKRIIESYDFEKSIIYNKVKNIKEMIEIRKMKNYLFKK